MKLSLQAKQTVLAKAISRADAAESRVKELLAEGIDLKLELLASQARVRELENMLSLTTARALLAEQQLANDDETVITSPSEERELRREAA